MRRKFHRGDAENAWMENEKILINLCELRVSVVRYKP
jgi:hypothetical protein